MIHYDKGEWGIAHIWTLKGSVFGRAFCIALPNAILAALLHLHSESYQQKWLVTTGFKVLWGSFTFVLGFLIVFRNGQAYSRFRMGAKLMNKVKTFWLDAAQSFVVFCSHEEEKKEKVEHFLQLLVRLFSMLHCAGLQQVSAMKDDRQDILNPEGIDPAAMDYLMQVENKMEVIIHWIRDLCADAQREGILTAAPPILSRGIQELASGQVALYNVRKIVDIPFPFPYAQVLSSMIMVHWVVTPILASQAVSNWIWCSVVCFLVVFAMWALLYIALELDQPFGDDCNDLPLRQYQSEFNQSLLQMIRPEVRCPPDFKMDGSNYKVGVADSHLFWSKRQEEEKKADLYGSLS